MESQSPSTTNCGSWEAARATRGPFPPTTSGVRKMA
jgi:hypothetical protein